MFFAQLDSFLLGLLGVSMWLLSGVTGHVVCHLSLHWYWNSWMYFLLHLVSGPFFWSSGRGLQWGGQICYSGSGLLKVSIPRRRKLVLLKCRHRTSTLSFLPHWLPWVTDQPSFIMRTDHTGHGSGLMVASARLLLSMNRGLLKIMPGWQL